MMKNKIVRIILLGLGVFILCITISLIIGYIYEPFAQQADAKAYPPPGKMVDVGGYKLHINCKGVGSPTVIIDAGWGGWSSSWENVQDIVAQKTQVCIYDRAGMGWSDAGPKPRNAEQFSKELRILIQKIGVPPPFVLAGHSSGGYTVRVYAHKYPSDIAGIVLIDSMSPKQYSTEVLNSHPSPVSQESSFIPILARFGIVRMVANFISYIDQGPTEDKSTMALTADPKFIQTFLDEGEGLPKSAFEASQVKSFGDIPLVVLSAGKENSSFKSWDEMQRELLYLSSNSQHFIAQNSGHDIAIDQPEAAVNAIITLLKLIELSNLNE